MRLLCISDVHGRFGSFQPENLPAADMCLLAGDMTNRGLRDTREFIASEQWLARVVDRYRTVLWIPGNYDLLMPPDVYHPIGVDGPNRLRSVDRALFVNGGLSFCGVSMSPSYDMPELAAHCCHMTTRPEVEDAAYDLPPCDVLLSHCPPYGVLNAAGRAMVALGQWETRPIGARELRAYIDRHAPKLVVCGHVHINGLLGKPHWETVGQTLVLNTAETWAVIETDTWEVIGTP